MGRSRSSVRTRIPQASLHPTLSDGRACASCPSGCPAACSREPCLSAGHCANYRQEDLCTPAVEVNHESVCSWTRPDRPFGLAPVVRAEPLDLKQVPADAKWLVHVDVDAMRASTLVQKAWPKCMEMHKDAEQRLKSLRDKFGIDVCKDLHGLTAYGKELGKHTGVLIVHAKFDLKLAEATAAKAKDHKVVKFDAYDLHSWTEKHHGHARTVWAAAYKARRTRVRLQRRGTENGPGRSRRQGVRRQQGAALRQGPPGDDGLGQGDRRGRRRFALQVADRQTDSVVAF